MPLLTADYLRVCLAQFAAAFGADDAEAAIFADCHVRADLRGHHTQGVQIIPIVYDFLKQGIEKFGVVPSVVRESDGFAVIDSGNEVGVVAATRAMQCAIWKASNAGIGCVWVQNAGVFDMAGNYALQAIEHDQIGIATENGVPFVSPWGGRDPFFSTNPIAIAIPSYKECPIVIDMSAGSFSAGNVLAARKASRLMPSAHLVDAEGRYTDDPQRLDMEPPSHHIASGAIVAQGPRGYAWAILVEVLAGLLPGMNASFDNVLDDEPDRPRKFGQFFMAIDVAAITDPEQFKRSVDRFVRALKTARPAEGFEEVMLPGEQAYRNENARLKDGIPIDDADWKVFWDIAGELGLACVSP